MLMLTASVPCYNGKLTPADNFDLFPTPGYDSSQGLLGMGIGDYGQRVRDETETGGRSEALRMFAEGRAMKTGTTIAGVVFQVGSLPSALTVQYTCKLNRHNC